LDQGTWIDLTYDFDSNTLYWPTDTLGFRLDTVFHGHTENDYFYAAYGFSSAEHGGTHLDAPVHFAEGKLPVNGLSLDQLIGTAVIIDVSDSALANPDYLVSIADFERFEAAHGTIPEAAIVLLRTGYGAFWPDRERYLGTNNLGPEAVPLLHFPGLGWEAAQWLCQNRQIKAIGLDTPSIDYGQSSLFRSHRILFEQNIPVFENLANLDKLPITGSWVMALPMKIKGGSGAPLRAVAWIPPL
jgi:kynurenine formamidase